MPPEDDAASDLTGLWHGQYAYAADQNRPAVPFEANLIDTDDFLGGAITERAMDGSLKGRPLYATISGRRCGHAVRFLKTYEMNPGNYTSAGYEGVLSADGLEISGIWKIGNWSGRFLMIRAGGLARTAKRHIHEDLPAS